MAEVQVMPRMSDTMEEGVIVGWLKAEGDTVEVGDLLAEVETDKATMELDSEFEGTILHIAIKEGAVPIGGALVVVGEEGEDWKAALAEYAAAEGGATEEPKKEEAPATETTATPTAEPTPVVDSKIKASPLAKSMAKEAGIDLSTLSGTGDNGRIVKKDIESAISNPAPAAPVAPAAPIAQPATTTAPAAPKQEAPNVAAFAYGDNSGGYTDIPVTQMRKTIARRLGESKFTAPHFYLTVEIDMDAAWDMRKKINEVAPVKISFNDIVIKACAIALREHPAVNSSWLGDKIRQNNDVNIGVAVAVPDGLLVPVIKMADIKTLSQLNTEVKQLAGKAKSKKLSPAEMTGNTFTISNLGMFGIEEFTAIVNPPDSCILAIGGIISKPVVKDEEIVVGKRMKVTLSCDHRVIDGATGAQFLNSIKAALENPLRFMI